MKPVTLGVKSGSSSSSGAVNRQPVRPSSAPPSRPAIPTKKKAKQKPSPQHLETVMPVPNRPLTLEERFVSDSPKARLSCCSAVVKLPMAAMHEIAGANGKGTRRLERHFNVTMRVTPLSRSRLAVEITGTQKEQVQLCQLYLEGTFEHMQPVVRPPRSHSSINNTGSPSSMDTGTSLATSLHTQLGSSSSLAQRYCIRRDSHSPSPSKQRDGHEVHQQVADALSARDQLSAFLIESDAVSPSAGGASIYRSVTKRMPTATALFATVQQRHEQQQELQHQQSHQHQQPHHHHQSAPAAAAASAAAKTIDCIHYHLLNERVSCIEAAIASLATTVSQLVQLLSAAADSSPQAAATIAAAAVQLTADIPVDSAPQSDTSRLSHSIGGASVGLEAASPAYEISNYYSQPTRGADSASCLEAVHNNTGSHCEADRSPSIATPEFHLRRKIVRVSDLHERLAAIPSGLPAHAAVRVTRQ